MDLQTWLHQWLRHHPVKQPPSSARDRFTASVMTRIRAVEEPAAVTVGVRRWVAWPQFGLAVAAAAAIVLLLVWTVEPPGARLAWQIAREVEMLVAVEESLLEPLVATDPETLADDLEALDEIVLAEAAAAADDDRWIRQTLDLLESLDEEDAEVEAGDTEEWLDELERLDEAELTASS